MDQLTFHCDKGKVMREEGNIDVGWKKYFDKLLNTQTDRIKLPEIEVTPRSIGDISALEVVQKLGKMKLNKAKSLLNSQ